MLANTKDLVCTQIRVGCLNNYDWRLYKGMFRVCAARYLAGTKNKAWHAEATSVATRINNRLDVLRNDR